MDNAKTSGWVLNFTIQKSIIKIKADQIDQPLFYFSFSPSVVSSVSFLFFTSKPSAPSL